MGVNQAASFSADIEAYIADETLPLARKQLVAYQFGDPLELDKGRGTTYTAVRFNRLPLPFAPLAEGVPPQGQQMTIGTVSATAQQWGDKVTITDVAEMTIKHPLFKKAIELLGLQVSETLERNTMNALMAGTQVNYVNTRGSRGALVAGDVMDAHTINRTVAALQTLGAPRFMGDEQTNTKIDAESGGARADESPRGAPHYTAIIHPLVAGDFSENGNFVLAATYSAVNRLYNYELGEWRGCRFCMSNMVPFFTGFALVQGAYAANQGTLAANATYYTILTGSDTQNQYESYVSQVAAPVNVLANNGAITLTTPNLAGYTFNVYIGTTNTPATLGTCALGPTTGPLAGQAVQLPANTLVTITGIGVAQTPPAAPATGVTVYPTFVIGRGAYGQVVLDNTRFSYLKDADKSDPLNQQRVVGWKTFYGTLIENNAFFARIEAASAFTSTFG